MAPRQMDTTVDYQRTRTQRQKRLLTHRLCYIRTRSGTEDLLIANLANSGWIREVCRGCSRGLNVSRGPDLVDVSGSALPGLHSTFYTGEVLIQACSAACDSDTLVIGIIEAATTSLVQAY
jgi:hypothetical protein